MTTILTSTLSIKRLQNKWGLKSICQQQHTSESIASMIQTIHKSYPSQGVETIQKQLRIEFNIQAPGWVYLHLISFYSNQSREVIMAYLKRTEPDAVNAHCHQHFYAAGISDVWCLDQHDKWGPHFGLWLHNCINPFIGFNNWLKVWWTNKNLCLITSYYLETVQNMVVSWARFLCSTIYFSYIFCLQLFLWSVKVILEAKIIWLQIFIY